MYLFAAPHHTHHYLISAQSKLLDRNIPHQLKIFSYIRICCFEIQKKRRINPFIASELHPQTPYLSLLATLANRDAAWWEECRITASGYLVSHDPTINNLLQPLNLFVSQQLEQQAA
jgi:hypothetical protein